MAHARLLAAAALLMLVLWVADASRVRGRLLGEKTASQGNGNGNNGQGNGNNGQGSGSTDNSAASTLEDKGNANGRNKDTLDFVPDELLVQFKPGKSSAAKEGALKKQGCSKKDSIADGVDSGELVLVKIPQGKTVSEMQKKIKDEDNDGDVLTAEPNYIYTSQVISNDIYYKNPGYMWGMNAGSGTPQYSPYGSGAGTSWLAGNYSCSNVYVGIIDTGAYTSHPDLSANYAGNPVWDFMNNDGTVFHPYNDDMHGTHVSGTIGAAGGNSKGVVGVCWNVKLMNAKFLGPNGGSTSNAIKAIDWFIAQKNSYGRNIVALSNSWGGPYYSSYLAAAIERANRAGITFVAAAGNGGGDGVGDNQDLPYNVNSATYTNYPSGYTSANVISVAAIDINGNLASFSNYGATTVDIAAPGVNIASTYPYCRTSTGATVVCEGYVYMSGTSMATPHVAGAVALYKSLYPTATVAQVRNALLKGAAYTPSLNGKVASNGRLNIPGMLAIKPV